MEESEALRRLDHQEIIYKYAAQYSNATACAWYNLHTESVGAARLKDGSGIRMTEIKAILSALEAHEENEDYTNSHTFTDSQGAVMEC